VKYFLYHEDNQEDRNDRPQEDFFVAKNNIFIVADGITHDLVNGNYPNPSEAFLVAKMAAEGILNYLKNNFNNLDDIKKAFLTANQKIVAFQKKSNLYKNRESNNYTFGATVIAAATVKDDKLYYGVLDDCFVSVFGNDGVDYLRLIPYVEKSAKYLFSQYNWDDLKGRKFWRKNIRNHQIKVGNKSYGYGALDGHGNYEPFLQIGEIELKKGDFICIYSDGFIKPLEDKEFVAKIRRMNGSLNDLEFIAGYLREKRINKEKSCYFIKYV
jgi:serine/threonine protein phosphatase PrpC